MSRDRNDSTPSAPSDSTATSSTPAPQNNNTSSSSTSSNSSSNTSSTTTTGNTGSSTAASSGPSDARKKFNAAFAKARREGKMTFTYNGKKYGTRRGSESKEDHAKKMRKAAGLPSTEELDKNIKEGEAADRRSNTQAARAAGIAGQAADDKRRKEEAEKKTEKKTESKPAATTETKKPVNNTQPQGKRVPEAGGRPESDARAAQRARVNFALEQRDKKKADRKAKRSAVRAAKSEARPGKARRQERRAVDKANRQNRRATIRDARRGGSTFQGGDGMKYGEKKKGKAGLKMVKNKDGKSVPFYAADGKGKMGAGGKYKMAYGGKLMGDGGNKVPVNNDRRAMNAGMEINYDDPFRYLSPRNRRAAEKMQKEGTLRLTGPAGGFLSDATFDQISGSARRMKQDDYGKRSGSISGKSGAAGSPKVKAPVSLRLAPPVGMPDPPSQGGGRDTRRGTVIGPGGSGTTTIRGSQQDPSTRDNKVVIDKRTGRMSRN